MGRRQGGPRRHRVSEILAFSSQGYQIWEAFMHTKEFLKSIPFFRAAVRTVRRRYYKWKEWKNDPVRHIRKALPGMEKVYVVQIGANDGKTRDPIHVLLLENPSWAALLVEPVPFLFERLRQNYANNSRFRFENVAIGDQVGVTPFYYVDDSAREQISDIPWWFDQVGSFDREHITRHFGNTLDRFIVTANISTLPLNVLLERNNINSIDLLNIDTEGYDWHVLRQLDLSKYSPKVILIEHRHLSPATKTEVRRYLQDSYRIIDLSHDYFCRKKS
jgi:FkbM family methyltransferase